MRPHIFDTDMNATSTPQPDNKNTPQPSSLRTMLCGNAFILIAIILFAMNIPVVKILIPQWMDAEDVTLVRLVGGGAAKAAVPLYH